jgi:predicted lipoprotein with Yx(FWY)xxD motif
VLQPAHGEQERTMNRSGRLAILQSTVIAAVVAVSALLAIGGAAAASRAHRASTTTLTTKKTKLGKVIEVSGRAVYLFAKDKGGKSSCSGKCATAWPPLIASGSVAVAKGSGLSSKLVGKVKRSNGQMQVTYNHHPLYFFSKDSKGSIHGENKKAFGARWYVVNAKGNAVKPKKSCPPGWTKGPTGCLPPGYGGY